MSNWGNEQLRKIPSGEAGEGGMTEEGGVTAGKGLEKVDGNRRRESERAEGDDSFGKASSKVINSEPDRITISTRKLNEEDVEDAGDKESSRTASSSCSLSE